MATFDAPNREVCTARRPRHPGLPPRPRAAADPRRCEPGQQHPSRPAAALIEGLEARGLLDDTLVFRTGEFGRTPFREGRTAKSDVLGRDHDPDCFTVWMAGGGVKAGHAHGSIDELGFRIASAPVHVHDLQATILHPLGFDHTKLTWRFRGHDFRLTDVHGNVVQDILA